jgi:cation diffusion facilitator CzcD-associated flavoprotein CzcO
MDIHPAIIIGAGPAGLSAAAALKDRGITAVVVDRSDAVASSWRHRPEGLRLNSGRWMSQLPGTAYPRHTPVFPTRDQEIAYLETYAAEHADDLRTGVEVRRIDRAGDDWALDSTAGRLRARHVIVATGLYNSPRTPRWPGLELVADRLIHAYDYIRPEPFIGKDVLVIGSGTSGFEIAGELESAGATSVRLSVRTPPNIMPRIFGALPGVKQMMKLPPRLGDAQVRVIQKLTIGDLSSHGLPTPGDGPFTQLKRTGASPAGVDPEVLAAIRAGRIHVVPAVAGFDAGGVLLMDGSHLHVDRIIAATGYAPDLGILLGHLGVLDDSGIPVASGFRAAHRGLHFIGFENVPGQLIFCTAAARHIAKAISAGLSAEQPAP